MDRRIVSFVTLALLASSCREGGGSNDAGVDGGEPASLVIETEGGRVEGRRYVDFNVYRFGNIPYAAPPTGANRFRPPQPMPAWTDVRTYAPTASICPQKLPTGLTGFAVGSEDCLHLNVVIPSPRPTNAPVVVWIHGGGFTINSSEQFDAATNGFRLAGEHGVVVVTINYRLGPFGFLAHPALSAEQGGHSGNYGMLDQLAALRWVKANIAQFGGDPNQITLYGQSGGGMSICALMASPLLTDTSVVPAADQPLFHRAVLQSSPCDIPLPSLQRAEVQGQAFVTAVGCDNADPAAVRACLRDPAMATLVEVRDTLPTPYDFYPPGPNEAAWGPNMDGYYLDASVHPVDTIAAGAGYAVPTLAGFTEDEGNTGLQFRIARSSTDPATLRTTDGTGFDALRSSLFEGGIMSDGPTLDAVPAYNPAAVPAPYADIAIDPASGTFTPQSVTTFEQAIAAIRGHMEFACPARRTMRALVAGGAGVHAYFTRYDNPPFQLTAYFPLGAFHNGDTQLFFGVPAGGALLNKHFTDAEEALSLAMRTYLTNFIRTGDPNGVGLTAWPPYDGTTANEGTSTHLVFDTTIAAVSNPLDSFCDVWDTLGRARIASP